MKGDIQLPNESGKRDPRLDPSELARQASMRQYERRQATPVKSVKKDSVLTTARNAYRSFSGSR